MSDSKGLVLVVEDEKNISDLLRMYLTREGFGVHVEADGAAGGQKIVFELTSDGKLQVRDSGPGLSADDIKVAFQPGELYERYKGVRRVGTGFGLALVGRLANRLGVIATAGKAPEGGASFTIDFEPVINA